MPKPNPALHDPNHDPRPVIAIIALAVVIALLIYYFKLRR